MFVDADTRINADALRSMMQILSWGAAGGGCMVMFDPPVPLWARALLPVVVYLFRVSKLSGGACLFCSRVAFDATGGWDEMFFAGEEIHFAKALKAVGPFVVPLPVVETSGRKLRTHGGREILGAMWRMMLAGPTVAESRDLLDLWYGERREDVRRET